MRALKDSNLLAIIERADFLRLNGSLTPEVLKVLAMPYEDDQRSTLQLELCRNLFHGTAFFQVRFSTIFDHF